MRIIAGTWRGRRLLTPADRTIRPTGERAREALFSMLAHGAPALPGARFLDLFCGTGAIGLEAASRGAAAVLLVDDDARALMLARANLERLGGADRVRLLRRDATRLGPAPAAYDFAFLDPPYGSGLAAPALAALQDGWLGRDARIVVELDAKERFAPPAGYAIEQERRYGAARFAFLRVAAG